MRKNLIAALLIVVMGLLPRDLISAQEISYPKGTKYSTIWVRVPSIGREGLTYGSYTLIEPQYTYAVYRINGYIYKNEFINNSPISIFNREGETVIKGTYRRGEKKENFIIGSYCFSGKKGTCILKGTFEIKTHSQNQFFSKKKRTWEVFQIVPLKTEIGMSYSFSQGKISIQNDSIAIMFGGNAFGIKQISAITPKKIVSVSIKDKDYKDYGLSYLKSANNLYLYLNFEPLIEINAATIYFNDGSILTPQKLWLKWNNDYVSRIIPEGKCLYQWKNGDNAKAVLTENNNFFNVYSESNSLFYALICSAKDNRVDCESRDGKTFSYNKWLEIPQWSNEYEWKKRLQTSGSWTNVIDELEKYKKSYQENQERVQEEGKERLRQQEEKKKEDDKRYKTYLMQEYGSHFAEAIMAGRVEKGMTKQMVREATDLVHYDIVYEQGCEIWIFDEEKTVFKMKKKANIWDLSSEQYMGLLLQLRIAQLRFPFQIIFRNGKVVDIIK